MALVTPARHASRQVVEAASAAVRSWGLDPVMHPDTNQAHGQFGGTDVQRAAALNAAFADPEVGAVWVLRGGYGCTRLLPHLDAQRFQDNPTWIVGFSDATALHGWANQAGVASLHAPVASTLPSTDDNDVAALVEVLKTAERKDKEGHLYYAFEYVTKTNSYERHALTIVTITQGQFYTLTAGSSERRWEKMGKRLQTVIDSFNVYY